MDLPTTLAEDVDEEIKEEIEDLLDNVPQLKGHFDVLNKIGSGTFSTVYVARLKNKPEVQQLFALKYIIPTSHPSRIVNELQCLRDIGGQENVMGVKCCLRQRDHVVIVMPYFPHERFMDYVSGGMTVAEVQRYMYNLLRALRHVHACNMIHRDVKPSNFLFNRKLNQYALVDFGLAQKCETASSDKLKADVTKNAQQRKTRSKVTDIRSSPRKRKIKEETSIISPPELKSSKTQTVSESATQSNTDKKREQEVLGELQNIQLENEYAIKTQADEESKIVKQIEKEKFVRKADENDSSVTVASKAKAVKGINDVSKTRKETSEAKEGLVRGTRQISAGSKTVSPRRAVLQKQQQRMRTGSYQGGTGSQHSKIAGHQHQGGVSSQQRGTGNQHQSGGTHQKFVQQSGTKHTTVVVKKDGKPVYRSVAPSACECFGKLMICTVCTSRSNQHAPRAGTPGFRAPEVLLKYPHQTTAVDIWSAGVIFLSLLSWRYPFFKAPDDVTALAQIMCTFGSRSVAKAAKRYGKNVVVATEFPETDLQQICEKLRKNTFISTKMLAKIIKTNPAVKELQSKSQTLKKQSTESLNSKPETSKSVPEVKKSAAETEAMEWNVRLRASGGWDEIPETAYDLLRRLLDLNPLTRITAEEALKHEYFNGLKTE